MIRVVLVDDHSVVRKGIKSILDVETEIEVVGEAENGKELLPLLPSLIPVDVVLMDINMPEMDGIEASQLLLKSYPDIKILALSMHDNREYVNKMLQSGAAGYVSKITNSTDLITAIKTVAIGNPYISPEISLTVQKKAPEISQPLPNGKLSLRELEVLKLIADGLTNQEIGEQLFNSKRTIETHRQNLLAKFNCKNTAALVKYALQNNIIMQD